MNRIERLRQEVGLKQGQGLLIHKPSNIFYLSGFTGEGQLLITANEAAVMTDFRYTEQAERQAPGLQLYEVSSGRGYNRYTKELMEKWGVSALCYESDYVTVEQFDRMREAMPDFSFAPMKGEPEKLRRVKDEKEADAIRKACDISCQAFQYIIGEIKEGMTEKEIQLKLDYKMLELGGQGLAFNTIVASGENGSLPHAVPGERRVQKGDLITMDFGARYGGYCADMTRTVALGKPSDKLKEIYNIVLEAHLAAEKALHPGKKCSAIDSIARDYIAQKGYGKFFGHGLGHGVGIDIHEMPRLSQMCDETLAVGHVVTVEPGIYVAGLGGVRIENSCLITETGAESFVYAPRELLIL